MTRGAAFRGQPLRALCALLLGWAMVRAFLWESPLSAGAIAERVAVRSRSGVTGMGENRALPASKFALVSSRMGPGSAEPFLLLATGSTSLLPASLVDVFGTTTTTSVDSIVERPARLLSPEAGSADAVAADGGGRAPTRAAPRLVAPSGPTTASGSRWSADIWLLARRDQANAAVADRPSYGRSQAGGVVRYRLSGTSPLRPQAYVRASAALGGAREQEVAAGVSARVLPQVPLRFAAEARVLGTERKTQVRPAAFVVTELAPVELPQGIRAELYAQAGYVGGEYETAFVDGQARLEKPIARSDAVELSAGGGVWGGAQRGAARADVGPTAAVMFPLGRVRGRISADYRFRVAGDAAPSSGPALTLSAGF